MTPTMLRNLQTLLVITMGGSLGLVVANAVAEVSPLIPAVTFLIASWASYAMGLVAERRSLAGPAPILDGVSEAAKIRDEFADPVDDGHPPDQRTRRAITRRRAAVSLHLFGRLAATGLVVATLAFQWHQVLIGALGVFLLFVMFGAPVWLASLHEEEQDELETRGYRAPTIR